MKSVEKSAKTQEEAIQAALDELNVSITDVDIKVLDEGSKGLFGLFGSKPARVLVTLKSSEIEDELDSLLQSAPKKAPAQSVPSPAPERKVESPAERPVQAAAPSAPAEEPQPEAKPAARKPEPVRRTRPQPKKEKPAASKPAAEVAPAESKQPVQRPAVLLEKPEVTMLAPDAVDPESAAGKALSFLEELTRLMGVSVTVSVGTDAEGNVYGRMEGDTLGVLIGRRGETLDALQYLTSLKVNRGQETYTRVTLDTEDYRSRREETLIRLANRMANRAVRTNRRVSLEPMNPYERRIIHSALQGNEAVDTHSEGDEPNRHVVITIKK